MICFEPFHFTKLDTGTFSGKSALEVSGQPYACEAGEQLIPYIHVCMRAPIGLGLLQYVTSKDIWSQYVIGDRFLLLHMIMDPSWG